MEWIQDFSYVHGNVMASSVWVPRTTRLHQELIRPVISWGLFLGQCSGKKIPLKMQTNRSPSDVIVKTDRKKSLSPADIRTFNGPPNVRPISINWTST